jgi:NADPH:quinone reductase-like Zn-dependent oxidoreductase
VYGSRTVQAIVQERYGRPDVLALAEIEPPVPGARQVLVRVRASSVHPDVWHAIHGIPYALRLMGSGLRRPKHPVPGTDVAGVVEAVGDSVRRFRPGDAVFGETLEANLWRNGGAHAELVAVSEHLLEAKPERLTFEQAAAVPNAAKIAVQGLRDEGRLQPGQRVLIIGAGGGVGTAAVQVAKAMGAAVVAGVDAAPKLAAVRGLGADRVLDHATQDFTRTGDRYDLILDIAGGHGFSDLRRALEPDGTYVLIGHDHYGTVGRRWIGSLGRFARLLVLSPFVRQLPGLRGAKDSGDRLRFAKALIDDGRLAPVVARTFPLSEVPDAIRHLEGGGAVGRIVISVGG